MAQTAARQRIWMPAAVLALGVAAIVMLIGTNRLRERLIEHDLNLVRAIDEIGRRMATSHLWVEEYVTGDEVDMGPVWRDLDRGLRLAQALLEGGRVGGGQIEIEPLRDPALRGRAERLRARVEEFVEISRERHDGYREGEDVGIGSEIDERYDALFFSLSREADALEDVLGGRLLRNADRARLLFRAILLAWVAIVGLAVTGLWTRERRRQRAEAALEKSRDQLLQAQKMEAVGRLAGGIAHDINNYLGAITSQCELVEMKAEPGSAVARKMKAAIATALKISALIEQLLAFSKPRPANLEVVNLNRVVTGLETMMRRLIGEDVRLSTRLADDLWMVKVDPAHIEQIIVNLLVNAREAMPAGGSVTIETSNAPSGELPPQSGPTAAGEHVLLAVSDTGPGVPAEIRGKIFEPFFTTKKESGSSGLGLATVYGIVEQYGGHVRVGGEEGKGAAFEVYLPRSREEESAAAERIGATPVAAAGSERILLVEDNDELRESTRAVLEEFGYRVTAASNGREALEIVARGGDDIALVVTDVVMPGMGGRELMDRIAEMRSDLGAIFVSGYADDVVFRHGVADGEVDFVPKPFSAHTLARKVREVLHRRSSSPP